MPSSISTRSIANVTVSFGALASFGAKIYAAAREESSGLNLVAVVDGKVQKPVQQYAVNGTVIPYENLGRGVESGDGSYVLISKDEIAACKAVSSKEVKISKFIPLSEVDPLFFDKSYFLAPNVDKKEKSNNPSSVVHYALLLKVMEVNGLVAQAKLEMRGKEHNVLIRASAGRLMLHTLFNTSEVRTVSVQRPTFEIGDDLVEQGTALVNTLVATFDPAALTSSDQEKLNALISRKLAESRGETPSDSTSTSDPETDDVNDLLARLKASLAAAAAKTKVTA